MQPPQQCYDNAVHHKAMSYQSIDQNLADMKGCVASGYPFVFGLADYESFESQEVASTGDVPVPGTGDAVVGGHCVVAAGYDDEDASFVCRNSWGSGWGDAGYFYVPYAYLLNNNLSNYFRTIRVVE
jgi:C1A family cysteine protease